MPPMPSPKSAIEKRYMSDEYSSTVAEKSRTRRITPGGRDASKPGAAPELDLLTRQTGSGTHPTVQTNPGSPDLAGVPTALGELPGAQSEQPGPTNLSGKLLSERYLIEKCLGFGGMGSVWRAEHTLMKKTVAVKVLHSDAIGYGEAVERFRREAQAAAHIQHPNVCVATDFGEMEDEGFFLVMEYLEGQSLDQILAKKGRLSLQRAIPIINQILAALSQAHQLGVIHRDLKPENIMLIERDGNPDFVKIMDFGIARVPTDEEQGDARLTRVGRVYGTPMYMSPEQASGATDIDQRTDLYALGVMLFEMLSGEPPFVHKSSARVMAMHLTEPPPSLRERAPEVRIPRALDQLILEMMAKDPAERPASASEVRARLEQIAKRAGGWSLVDATREITNIMARPAGMGAAQTSNRLGGILQNRKTLGIVSAALIALLLVVAFSFMRAGPPELSAEDHGELSQHLGEERLQFLEDIDARDVIHAMAMGNTEHAIERLRELIDEHEPNPHLYFLHGRANAGAEDWTPALLSYQRALEIEPDYAASERLIDDLLEPFRVAEDEDAALAQKLLIEHVPLEEANRHLSLLARLGENAAVRKRAYEALSEHERLGDLEDWNRASIELRFANGCNDHRRRIQEIVDTQNPRGLEVLRYYQAYRRTGCGQGNRQDCYGCIRKDIDEAILAIEENLPTDDSPAADTDPDMGAAAEQATSP